MLNFPIIASKAALLIQDLQNDFRKPGAPLENKVAREVLLPRQKKLAAWCRSKGIPVVYCCHSHRRDGSDAGIMAMVYPSIREKRALIKGTEGVEVYEEMKPEEGDIVVEKRRYSCFFGNDLEMILRGKGIDTVIITSGGINIGSESTARDAANRDFKVVFLSDGNIGHDMPDVGFGPIPKEVLQKVSLSNMAYAFAKVISIDQLMAECQ